MEKAIQYYFIALILIGGVFITCTRRGSSLDCVSACAPSGVKDSSPKHCTCGPLPQDHPWVDDGELH